MLDLSALRADTPGVQHRIHLNNAGASLMPRPVIQAIQDHIQLESEIGGYEAEDARADEVRSTRDAIAQLLGAPGGGNVALHEHATSAFAAALSSIPFRVGDSIVTTRNDYASNQLMYLSLERRLGVRVLRAADLPDGGVDPMALEELVHRNQPKLVAVTHVPTNSGLVQDVEAVGEICRRRGVWYLVDACQSVGQMPLDVTRIHCDFLSATARKFLRGPRGVGFLYVSDRALDAGLEPLFIDMKGADWTLENDYQPAPDAVRFETWEFAYAMVLGMGAAARYALDVGIEAARDRSWSLATRLRERLAEMDGVRVLDRGGTKCAIVTASFARHSPPAVMQALRQRGINTSTLSSVAAPIDWTDKGVDAALRMSPHYFNTDEDVDSLEATLREVTASA
jgi:selenocysteine lyase/cysteine desulfurase